jgi:hypothetical protein
MSNQSTSKPLSKPLKGGSIIGNTGQFNTISANSISLESINVAGLFEEGIFLNVVIQDSELRNCVIGANGRNALFASTITSSDNVTFNSYLPGANVSWDATTGLFYISSNLQVGGCSQLGNIEICNNDITSTNLNGNINVTPNGLGGIYLNAPIYNKSSNGSLYSEMSNGGASFIMNNDIVMYSSHGSVALTTLTGQTYASKNGNLTLSVDNGLTTGNLSGVNFTGGNILVKTSSSHNLVSGNVITLSNSLLSGAYTVGTLLGDNSFLLTTTLGNLSTSSATGGSFTRSPTSNIILDSKNLVLIPQNTHLSFGDTTNAVWGNTGGLLLTSTNNITFSSGSNSVIYPQSTNLQLGTSGSNHINFDGSSLNIAGTKNISVSGSTTLLNTTNVKMTDPVITIANYNPTQSDIKDRGVEFNYWDSATSSQKLGWFGFKTNTKTFAFIPDATNNGEVISGSPGNIELNSLVVNTITMNKGANILMQCGSIFDVSSLSGCEGTISISGTNSVTLSSSNRIALSSGGDVLVPTNIPLRLGTSGSYIAENTSSNLLLTAAQHIFLSTSTGGFVVIPQQTGLSFDGTTTGLTSINANTSGSLTLRSKGDINLTATNGSVKIPQNTPLLLGTLGNLVGNTTGVQVVSNNALYLTSSSDINVSSSSGNITLAPRVGDINLSPTLGNVRIPSTRSLVFGTTNSIQTTSGGDLQIAGAITNSLQITNISTVNLLASSAVNIPSNTRLNLTTDGSKYIYSDNTSLYIQNLTSTGSIALSAATTYLTNTGGNLNVSNNNTLVSTGNFYVSSPAVKFDTDSFRVKDPIITVGDYTTADNKDRGLQYQWTSSTVGTKLGWFGRKYNTGRFTYYSDATNTGEVITGTVGDIEVGSAYVNGNVNFVSSGNLNLNCGTITNTSVLSGCGGAISILGSNSITQIASSINLSASNNVKIPYNVPLCFNDTTNSIICNSNGNMLLSSKTVTFSGNLVVNGTTTTVYSTVTNIQDPIVSLGGVSGPTLDDGKDRGIEFKWNQNGVSKTGFFGYKNSTGRFAFIRDGINNNEVYSGAYSDAQFGDVYANNVNLGNGNITGVKEVSGGTINIVATSGNIALSPSGGSVLIPYNTPLAFGTTQNAITTDTSGNTIIATKTNLTLQSTVGINTPSNVPLNVGSSAILNTGGNLVLSNTSGNIYFTPKSSLNVPTNTAINFGSTSNNISSDGTQLNLSGYKGINLNSDVSVSGNLNIIGSLSANGTSLDYNDYIFPLGNNQQLQITNIGTFVGTGGNVIITTNSAHNLVIGDTVTLKNTNSVPAINGTYTIASVPSSTTMVLSILSITSGFSTAGTSGVVKSALTTQQGADVGIQVNYWSTTGNANATAGTVGYKTGYFGFQQASENWVFYTNASISNNVATGGTLGNIQINKLLASRISGFTLDGGITGGSNPITGTNFQVGGGTIDSTPIGTTSAQSGRFTNLSNTVSASLSNVSLQSSLAYNLSDTYTLSSTGVTTRNPSVSSVVSMFSVSGTNYTTSSGTMPSTSVPPGTYKILMCQQMGVGCSHTIYFGPGKLIAPNPLDSNFVPTKLIFKRTGQSAQLIFTGAAWVLIGSGAYVG